MNDKQETGRDEPQRVVPKLPDPPPRHTQDTQEVEGEDAIHPPPEDALTQRSKVQG